MQRDNKRLKVHDDSCGESSNIPSGNTEAGSTQTTSHLQLRILVCSKDGMLLYKCSHTYSRVSVSAVREFKLRRHILACIFVLFHALQSKYFNCYKIKKNYKIYLNYLCFHFSTKEEQRHDRTTAKHSRQRRSKEKHARPYICGNVKNYPCVYVFVFIYVNVQRLTYGPCSIPLGCIASNVRIKPTDASGKY